MSSSNPDEHVILPETNDESQTENETSFRNQRRSDVSPARASTATPTSSELLDDDVDRDSESKSKLYKVSY